MKKIFLTVFFVIVLAFLLVSCSEGSTPINTNPKNLYAIITLPNGDVVEGKVKEYHRYSDSCVEVYIEENVYFIHSVRVAFVNAPPTEKDGE